MSALPLEVDRLCVAYGRIAVVKDLTFSIEAGKTLALLGANGAGKTSAIEAIAGLLPKSAGMVRLFGENITWASASQIASMGLGLVPQWRELFPTFSVEETLHAGLHAGARRGRNGIEDIYALFPRLRERRNQMVGTLSGGEQQMLTIGRALAIEPRMLLLDEPTAGLAVAIIKDLLAALKAIKSRNIPILLVEQNIELAAALAEECLLLSTGTEVWRGPMLEALHSEDVRQLYFGPDRKGAPK